MRAIFQVQAPGGGGWGGGDYISRGDSSEDFWVTALGGGGSDTWRRLFSEFYGIQTSHLKFLVKLGNIVAETLFLVMFPGLAN